MSRVIHFEISADNVDRAVAFYRKVFDWFIEKWDSPIEYWLVTTGPDHLRGIDGAILKRVLPSGFSTINTISVDSIEMMVKKVIDAGGAKFTEIETIPGIGQFCYCTDTEGNHFGLMQSFSESRISK